MADIASLIAGFNPDVLGQMSRIRQYDMDQINLDREGKILSLQDQLAAGTEDLMKKYSIYNPQGARQMFLNEKDQLDRFSRFARKINQAPLERRAQMYGQLIKAAPRLGIDVSDIPSVYNEEAQAYLMAADGLDMTSYQEAQLEENRLNREAAREREQLDLYKPTTTMRDYEFFKQQLMNNGVSENEASQTALGAVKKGVNVNVGDSTAPQAKKFNEQLGKAWAEDYSSINAAAKNANNTISTSDEIIKIANNPNVYFGPGAKYVKGTKKLAQSLGLADFGDSVNQADVMTAYGNRLAMQMRNPDSGFGLTGSTSDRDVQFLLDSVPNLSQTREGAIYLANLSKASAQRDRDLAKLANEYRRKNGVFDSNDFFVSVVEKYDEENPLIKPEEINKVLKKTGKDLTENKYSNGETVITKAGFKIREIK